MPSMPGHDRLLKVLAGVPELCPRTEQRLPPIVTWDDGPCGRTAAAAVAAAGFEVTGEFWGGALADLADVEPCVFQRVLRPETAVLLYLHSGEPDTPEGDRRVADRVFATDLPARGYAARTPEEQVAAHLLAGEVSAADFGGDTLFTAMGRAVRRTFGGRAALFDLARSAAI
jgi:hypothetical protein